MGLGLMSAVSSLGSLGQHLPAHRQDLYWLSWWQPWQSCTNTSQGLLLKKSDPQTVFAVTLKLVFTETFPSIFPRFSMKRVTCFRFEQSFNHEPFAQSVVKFAFKKDQLNALKVCYIGTWKNSNLGELANQTFQWKMVNGCNVTNGILYRFINCSICPL